MFSMTTQLSVDVRAASPQVCLNKHALSFAQLAFSSSFSLCRPLNIAPSMESLSRWVSVATVVEQRLPPGRGGMEDEDQRIT